jgi:hypothetical protein
MDERKRKVFHHSVPSTEIMKTTTTTIVEVVRDNLITIEGFNFRKTPSIHEWYPTPTRGKS